MYIYTYNWYIYIHIHIHIHMYIDILKYYYIYTYISYHLWIYGGFSHPGSGDRKGDRVLKTAQLGTSGGRWERHARLGGTD